MVVFAVFFPGFVSLAVSDLVTSVVATLMRVVGVVFTTDSVWPSTVRNRRVNKRRAIRQVGPVANIAVRIGPHGNTAVYSGSGTVKVSVVMGRNNTAAEQGERAGHGHDQTSLHAVFLRFALGAVRV
jgi:hypothetical protein